MRTNHFAPAGRRHRRQRKLGSDAACVFCGITDVVVLRWGRAPRSMLEEHHWGGQAHDPYVTVILCLNHHALVSAKQIDDNVPLKPESNMLERLIAMLESIRSSLPVFVDRLAEWIKKIRQLVEGLDRDYPGWRKKPWARP